MAVYLLSDAASCLANAIMLVAIPLLVLSRTGSAMQAGLVAIAAAIPASVVGFLCVGIVDIFDRRKLSAFADFLSAASVVALLAVDTASTLTIAWFALLGTLGAAFDIPGETAREALAPDISSKTNYSLGKVIGGRHAIGASALLLGPTVAAITFTAHNGRVTLMVAGVLSVLAALLTLSLPRAENSTPLRDGSRKTEKRYLGILVGLKALLDNRFLVAVTTFVTISVSISAALQGIVVPAHFVSAGQPERTGSVLTFLAIGMIIGSLTFSRYAQIMKRRTWFVYSILLLSIGVTGICVLPDYWMLIVFAWLAGLGAGPMNSLLGTAVLETIPSSIRGRVLGTQAVLLSVAASVSMFGMGLVVDLFSPKVGGCAAALTWVSVAIFALRSSSFKMLDRPGGQPCD